MVLHFDSSFIQPEEHRPTKQSTSLISDAADDDIPVIDLSPFVGDPNSDFPAPSGLIMSSLVSQIGAACEQGVGFQVVNHGIPLEVCRRVVEVSAEFFRLPVEEKRRIRRDECNRFGYFEGEHTKNVRDWKELFDCAAKDPAVVPLNIDPHSLELTTLKNQWPEKPPHFRTVFEEYTQEVEKLAYKMLELISLSLGLEAKELHGYFDENLSFHRINYYPPCPSPDLVLGVGRHKDDSALTILAQDEVGGLQVKTKRDGKWIDVIPLPDSFVVLLGDVIQVWSNDRYEGVEHRVVVNSEKERISFPFFVFPSHHVMVKPLDKLLSDSNPPRYNAYNMGKFYTTRNLSDFQKLDVENIQIDHFKI